MEQTSILVVGAGPTGLGAATRLEQLGFEDWLMVDVAEEAGGLACTDETKEGFLFDMGGHVIFSHFQYFDELLDRALGKDAWNLHQRVSYVWIKGRWVAYPFQNNIAALPRENQIECLQGLVEARVENAMAQNRPATFDEWILRVMGNGIADLFMRPYNFKVWGVPPIKMQCGWLGERVATVNVDVAIENVLEGKEAAGWGPNATFRFPKHGGTGAIWKGVAKLLPEKKKKFGPKNAVVGIDLEGKCAEMADGRKIKYKAMLSTMPLDLTLRMLGKTEWPENLVYGSSHIIGIGLRGKCPHGTKCWLYFPESDCPYYRCTIFSNYAEANCPPADKKLKTICKGDGGAGSSAEESGPYWSLMFEVTESAMRPVDNSMVTIGGQQWPAVVLETMKGAIATSMTQPGDEIVSLYHRRLEHGYPVPALTRDPVLKEALPWLKKHGIWSRGRFGGYKYEVANQDHSLAQGVQAADNILNGTLETTFEHPTVANNMFNDELLYSRRGGL
ncbi:hypothetical protein BSKO_12005 [Bryopsis sp. KO-2023]|nr:hypothetical protein BSKO_12005 [Bryopsis sp. KO-2023]